MRRALAIAAVLASAPAVADPEPPGALGVVAGVANGTGAAAKVLGFGYYVGGQASWQWMRPARRWGITARISTLFGTSPQHWFFMSPTGINASAAQVEDLSTVQMDATIGLRVRPSASAARFVTFRVGGQALRANQPLPPLDQRVYYGAIATVGLDQYLAGAALLSVDVRYGTSIPLATTVPDQIMLLAGIAVIGP